jgi:hypothetical protein
MSVSKELSKYKLDLVGVQVRWEDGGTEPANTHFATEWAIRTSVR